MRSKPRFPEKYIKNGRFVLHSGQVSDTLYDVNHMLTNKYFYDSIIEHLRRLTAFPEYRVGNFVGIATGGAIIASHFRGFAMIKDGELIGDVSKKYCLIDDVCTTESSLKEAIKMIGHEPLHIFVVLDRREKRTLDLYSIYEK